jgi:sugar phosphate isomerase/epimerase
MRFACLTTVAPGRSLAEQCAALAAAGCTGAETIIFPETPLDAWEMEFGTAALNANLAPAVVILGGLALYRPGQMAWIGEALEAIAGTGAAALITPEYRAQDPLPLFPPFPAPSPAEAEHVATAVTTIARRCAQLGVPLYLEPITHFEGRFWQMLAPTATLSTEMGRETGADVGVVADLHNMNITEADPLAAIHAAGRQVRHVHLADNNRRLPGQGHIDFAAALQALRSCGYAGWHSFECAVEGDFTSELSAAIQRLRRM